MKYQGSCHCGKVAFEVEGELINGAMACNCSICSRKGSLLWFVPRDRLRLLTAEEEISTYTFNKHVIKHRFCATCGIHPYGEGSDHNGNRMAAVNIRCLEGIDVNAIPVQHFDGRSL
ncbi:MAG: GFA family protein [Alphaproteobacteria bacterium]